MIHLDPRFTAIISVLFIVMGLFNLYVGLKRLRTLRARGYKTTWYKQVGLLTGIEYSLLGIVLLLNLGISTGFFPDSLAAVIVPLYTIVLVLAAAVLLLILFQGITASRRRSQNAKAPITTPQEVAGSVEKELNPQQRAEQERRRRDRRKKAAAARRRQSGRA
ncbi:hypothetical protein KDA_38360 [Dictyobacter alpinus]|uniref:Uncharacterized protein n=1 Tax=Dictyobacter alpinus TaxID=2014873 RepID=A0A402BAM7_9CHLR|nr:hypothetical protein [Dictyobacter alpinus]GCE28352.1 hypothetical protein KDA_38360 [Dictyobacter alpinus]